MEKNKNLFRVNNVRFAKSWVFELFGSKSELAECQCQFSTMIGWWTRWVGGVSAFRVGHVKNELFPLPTKRNVCIGSWRLSKFNLVKCRIDTVGRLQVSKKNVSRRIYPETIPCLLKVFFFFLKFSRISRSNMFLAWIRITILIKSKLSL